MQKMASKSPDLTHVLDTQMHLLSSVGDLVSHLRAVYFYCNGFGGLYRSLLLSTEQSLGVIEGSTFGS